MVMDLRGFQWRHYHDLLGVCAYNHTHNHTHNHNHNDANSATESLVVDIRRISKL